MKLRPFELTLVIIFGVMAIVALIMIKGYEPPPKPGELASVGQVTIWGTMPAEGVNTTLQKLAKNNEAYARVSYIYFDPDNFNNALIRALADGQGPDLLLASHENLVELRKRILPIKYESYPLVDIQNIYIDGAQIFALSDGLYGMPIAVDPMMMYWNRDILTTYGYLEPPRTWEALVNTMFPKLIQRDFDRTIHRSVVAMGEYGNVRNAFGVISALFIQSGSGLVTEKGNEYTVKLQTNPGGTERAFSTAIGFYTRFSKPSNTLYSWNRSLSEDIQRFISEDLVFYFGFGSEGPQIEELNPNLNFDIAEIPQGETATLRRTYGKFYALSLVKTSKNLAGANAVMQNLGSKNIADKIAVASNMAPAFRSSVAQGSNSKYGRAAYLSAPISVGWLSPGPLKTNSIFEKLTQDVNENRRSVEEAVNDAEARLIEIY